MWAPCMKIVIIINTYQYTHRFSGSVYSRFNRMANLHVTICRPIYFFVGVARGENQHDQKEKKKR